MQDKIYIQITSGRGPEECCRVVALVLEKIAEQARKTNLEVEILEREQGPLNRTLYSATLSIKGSNAKELVSEWEGTVLWISNSPYRKFHKRKNWFVGVKSFSIAESEKINEKDFRYETLRASGPGGQHVNKTESAVRAIHIPSGLSVTASDQRSQLQNKKLATERLHIKLKAWETEQIMRQAQTNWDNHNNLQRGNPIKTIKETLN